MKREERTSKETYWRALHFSVAFPGRWQWRTGHRAAEISSGFWRIDQRPATRRPNIAGESVRGGRHPAWKSPLEIVYRNRTNRPRCNSDIAIFVKSKIARNLCYYGTSRRKKGWWMLRTVDNCETRNGHAFEFCEAHCAEHTVMCHT